MNIKDSKLFIVKNNTFVHPIFYVEAIDILEATRIAKEIVDYYGTGKVVESISILTVPILSLEKE